MCAAPSLGSMTELQLHEFGLILTLTTANFILHYFILLRCALPPMTSVFSSYK